MKSDDRRAKATVGAARRIILQCMFWYLITAGLFAVVESAIVARNVDREIEERILSVEDRIEPALSQAIWNLDDKLISLILAGVVDDPAIMRVVLNDESGEPSVSLASPEISARSISSSNEPRSFPLSYVSSGKPPRRIGALLIFPSAELRTSRIKDTVLFSIERTVLFIFILSAILLITIQTGLGRPLRELAHQISETDPVDPGKRPIAFSRAQSWELELVADAFNAMSGNVGATMAALNESRARLWSVFDDSPISLWEEDFSEVKKRVDEARASGTADWRAYFEDPGRIAELRKLVEVIDVNRSTLELLEVSEKRQVIGPLSEAIGDQALQALQEEFIALASGALSWEGESVHRAADGRSITLHIRLGLVPGHERDWSRILVSMLDVTGQKHAEHVLRKSLTEKELLLKEVHHRVKNNLQIICSLISIQSGSVEPDSETAASLADIESRVWSMALVHELLYENQDFAALDFPDYVRRLCDRVGSGYVDTPGRIQVRVDMKDDVRLILERAIPCGLLINELVVNSFKHAFPGGRVGTIGVSMERIPGGTIRLVVQDDGVGVADLSDMRKPRSIGFMLIESLSMQLGGKLEFSGADGFRAELVFPDGSV